MKSTNTFDDTTIIEALQLEKILGAVDSNRLDIADGLAKLLANTCTLQLKAQNYHWNVRGPRFMSLHELFGEQHAELSTAIDTIAERIKSLGFVAPCSITAFAELASIEDESGSPYANEMIEQLAKDHMTILTSALALYALTEETEDHVTSDLVKKRMDAHQQAIWILNSSMDF